MSIAIFLRSKNVRTLIFMTVSHRFQIVQLVVQDRSEKYLSIVGSFDSRFVCYCYHGNPLDNRSLYTHIHICMQLKNIYCDDWCRRARARRCCHFYCDKKSEFEKPNEKQSLANMFYFSLNITHSCQEVYINDNNAICYSTILWSTKYTQQK